MTEEKVTTSEDSQPPGAVSSVTPAPAESAFNGLPVFIIDKDDGLRELINRVAEEEGCRVVSYMNGPDIPSRIRQEKPALIFLSFASEDKDFLATCKAAQQMNAALIATGEVPSQRHVILAFQAGAVDFLVKPTTAEHTTKKLLNGLAFAKEVLKNTGATPPLPSLQEKVSASVRLERIKQHAKDVMALPQATSRVISACDNPKVDTRSLTTLTKLDPALSAALIKRANSASFGGARITSLEGAIVRLGYRMVRSIATLLSAFKMTDTKTQSVAFDRFGLWAHSLAVGVIAERLAHETHAPDKQEDYFLAGILHDFGKLFFDDYLHQDYLAINEKLTENNAISAMEKEVFGFSHDELGGYMAQRWQLPDVICKAIEQHHSTIHVTDEKKTSIPSVVYVANLVAKAMILGRSNNTQPGFLPDELWSQFGLGPDKLDGFLGSVVTGVKEFIKLLKMPETRIPITYVPPREGSVVRIEDGGHVDRLLDIFLRTHGWKAERGTDPNAAVFPTFVIHDLRQGVPESPTPAKLPDERQIVLKSKDLALPAHIPGGACIISGVTDYLAMLQILDA